MSSDGKEPGATWQNPQQQDSPVEHTHPLDAEGLTPDAQQKMQETHSTEQPVDDLPFGGGEMDNGYDEDYAYINSEDDMDSEQFSQAEAASNSSEVWHYITLIAAPLLFGGLTSLFVLPLIATERAAVPPTAFWPVAVVILLITFAQSIAVYYAGTNNGLWIVGTVGGFFLFLLAGCFAVFGLLPGLILLVALIASSVYLARNYIRPVPEGMVELVYAFEKYTRTLYPGPNIVFPWEKVRYTLNTRETQWPCPEQRVQVSRTEDVILRAEISYQLLPEDAPLAVTQVQNWEESLQRLMGTALQTIATTFTPDDFLIWPQGLHAYRATYRDQHGMAGSGARWEQVNAALLQYMRDKVALWGVQVNWIKIRDVVLAPHDVAILDTEPVIHVQSEEVKASNSSPATIANEVTKKLAGPEQPPVDRPSVATLSSTRSTGNIPKNILKEDILIRAYKEVHSGTITDPETIRGLAEKFEAVAQDPELNDKVSFDPLRAAQNLYTQAKRCEELIEAGITNNSEAKPEKPDWMTRPPTDDNRTGGG